MNDTTKINLSYRSLVSTPSRYAFECPMVDLVVSMKDFRNTDPNSFNWADQKRHVALVDTGAAASFLDLTTFDFSGLTPDDTGIAGNVSIDADTNYYYISVLFEGSNKVLHTIFGAIDFGRMNMKGRSHSVILGMSAIQALNVCLGPGHTGYIKI